MPDIYDQAYRRSLLPKFSFTPDIYDPELTERRGRAIRQGGFNRSSLLNEVNRQGLGGTSAGLDYLKGSDLDLAGSLEDITGNVFGRQRRFAEQQYSDEQTFRRNLELLRLNRKMSEEDKLTQLLAQIGLLGGTLLGGIGGAGGAGTMGAGGLGDYEAFLGGGLYA